MDIRAATFILLTRNTHTEDLTVAISGNLGARWWHSRDSRVQLFNGLCQRFDRHYSCMDAHCSRNRDAPPPGLQRIQTNTHCYLSTSPPNLSTKRSQVDQHSRTLQLQLQAVQSRRLQQVQQKYLLLLQSVGQPFYMSLYPQVLLRSTTSMTSPWQERSL